MTDYDHADALRFRAEADRLQRENKHLVRFAEELAAKLDAVPWEHLVRIAERLQGELIHQGMQSSELIADYEWLAANAPKESDE